MKEYIKPQTEAVVLSKEALMQNVVGSTNGDIVLDGKSNNSDVWDEDEE